MILLTCKRLNPDSKKVSDKNPFVEVKLLHFQSMNKLNNFKSSQYEVDVFVFFLIFVIENLNQN